MEMRDPLVASLGGMRVALLRNHGSLVCGRTVQEAFVEHHYLETACRGQIAALAGGAEYTLIADEVCAFAVQQVEDSDPQLARSKNWDACIRQAKRLDPTFQE